MTTRLEELLNFLAESPNDPFLKYAVTMEYLKGDDKERTRAGFLDLVSAHPEYVGTYYHYAKFLESQGEKEEALAIYQKGMEVAQAARNRHAFGELQGAYNLALGLDDDEDWDD